MATITPTALADVIEPELFRQYVLQKSTELSSFWQSGVIEDLTSLIMNQMGGVTVHMPFFNDLTGADEVVDDTADLSVAKITTGMDIAAKLYRAKVYGGTDLAADLAGSDPINVIVDRFAEYWNRTQQQTLLSAVAGATGAMAAEGTPLNTLDISGGTGAAAVLDGESFIDACNTLGDAEAGLGAVAIHSKTYALMRKQDLIDFEHASDQGKDIPYYMGKRVIVNDVMPVSGSTYTSYIFGQGAIGYGETAPKNPVEPWRDPLKGGGYDYIVQRRQFCLHPRGIKWVGTPVKATASNAELATAANWTRVYDHKLIKIVAFKHKLA